MPNFKLSKEIIIKEKPQKGLEQFVQEFYEDRMKELESAHINLEHQEFDQVSQLAHKWKGYSDPYGFNLLGEISKELELVSTNRQAEQSQDLLDLIDKYMLTKRELMDLT